MCIRDRLEKMQSVLGARIVLADAQNYAAAKEIFSELAVYMIQEIIYTPVDTCALESVRNKVVDTMPLYVNFTSGSSGVPKGCLLYTSRLSQS